MTQLDEFSIFFFHKILVKFLKKIREIFVYVGPAYVLNISQHVGVALPIPLALPSLACWYRLSLAGLSVSKSVLILKKTNKKVPSFEIKKNQRTVKFVMVLSVVTIHSHRLF